jgi:DNA-binding protein H-NS
MTEQPDCGTVEDLAKKKMSLPLSVEELQQKMLSKINAIPMPDLSEKKKKILQQRNSEQDQKNLDHTIQILHDRKEEAEKDGDHKKKFHCVAIERQEKDQFGVRAKINELQSNIETYKKMIPADAWALLEKFSELKDPRYWEKARQNGYTEVEISTYYKDVWGIEPRNVVKFLEIMKLQHKLNELQNSC